MDRLLLIGDPKSIEERLVLEERIVTRKDKCDYLREY